VSAARALELVPYAVAGWLFLCGLYGVVTSRNVVHLVVCLAVVQSSTYVLLLALGWREGAIAPVFQQAVGSTTPVADPVVQALMLTDVVVEATLMALLLALAVQAHGRAHTLDPDRLAKLRG
jgi:multicomponent Na+:H+ antiporter subunit C